MLNFDDNTELNFYQSGEEKCKPEHSYGPAVRDHFLIHYVIDGQGIFKVNGKEYIIKKNQGFLIWPNAITYYKADKENPWHYMWIGFTGLKAEEYLKNAGLTEQDPIFTYESGEDIIQIMKKMINLKEVNKVNELELLGNLYFYLSKLISNNKELYKHNRSQSNQKMYIRQSIKYIQANYWRHITVEDISSHLNLNRSYLYTLFKKQMNMSPQQFLINYRMKKACRLLQEDSLTISQIARSVGYNDPFIFSKIFKKSQGVSPKHYKSIKSDNKIK